MALRSTTPACPHLGRTSLFIRFGDVPTWQAMALEDQLVVNVKIGRFVAWLIGTQRLGPTADYVVARRPPLGRVVSRSRPEFFASFNVTAAAVGFRITASKLQWTALLQACAVSGRRPGNPGVGTAKTATKGCWRPDTSDRRSSSRLGAAGRPKA